MKLIFLMVTRAVSVLGLSRRDAWWKDAEILMLRHQLAVALRKRPGTHSRLTWPDRAWLVLLTETLPADRLAAMRLIVTPATILQWHRDTVRRRWARLSRRGHSGRPPTRRNVRSVVLQLAVRISVVTTSVGRLRRRAACLVKASGVVAIGSCKAPAFGGGSYPEIADASACRALFRAARSAASQSLKASASDSGAGWRVCTVISKIWSTTSSKVASDGCMDHFEHGLLCQLAEVFKDNVSMLSYDIPPPLSETLSWRELWRSGSFALLDLIWDTWFSGLAADRGLRLGIGQGPLENLDVRGVLQPIAFAAGGNPDGFTDLAPFEPRMTFREEEPPREWSAYAWDAHGWPHTSALYSPWQLLYVDNVLDAPSARLGLEMLQAPAERRDGVLNTWRELLEAQETRWQALDRAWRPLMKVLVRLQNRYLPEVTGRTRMLYDAGQQLRIDPWPAVLERFDAAAVASELGVSASQLSEAYWFLVERGIDREPQDGLELLRRARSRSAHKRVRGMPRRAQDLFDAAQVLWLFLKDLTGRPPERTPLWPLDGRHRERAALYDRGPATRTSREQLQAELVETGLYPHAVHVVGEGKSEREIVHRLVEALLGTQPVDELGFTDLGGSGSASRLATMVTGFTTYAQRTVVIVDTEGAMAQYVTGLIRSGRLPEEDVLRFDANLEDSNFTPAEMLQVLAGLAANPANGRPAVTLTLQLSDVLAAHKERCRKTRDKPGLAGTLLKLAEDPKYGGPVTIRKPDLALALADRMLDDLSGAQGNEQAIEALRQNRPLLAFVLDRVLPILIGPRWP